MENKINNLIFLLNRHLNDITKDYNDNLIYFPNQDDSDFYNSITNLELLKEKNILERKISFLMDFLKDIKNYTNISNVLDNLDNLIEINDSKLVDKTSNINENKNINDNINLFTLQGEEEILKEIKNFTISSL